MAFQWLQMRIQEEKDRREREARIQARLPGALEELLGALSPCIDEYNTAFGQDSASISLLRSTIRIAVKEPEAQVQVSIDVALPGFRVTRDDHPPLAVIVGILPGDRLTFLEEDKYITLEDLSRRVLDRALFPKLPE
jgi:hypothetical protein